MLLHLSFPLDLTAYVKLTDNASHLVRGGFGDVRQGYLRIGLDMSLVSSEVSLLGKPTSNL